MGNDGGSIAKRADLVKVKPVSTAKPTSLLRRDLATHCALSRTPLCAPVVLCRKGLLYSQCAVDVYLSVGKPHTDFAHLISPSDVRVVAAELGGKDPRLKCAFSGTFFTGNSDFVCLWGCGCLFDVKALHKIGMEASSLAECPYCGSAVQTGSVTRLRREICPSATTPVLTKRPSISAAVTVVKRVKFDSISSDLRDILAPPPRKQAEDLLLNRCSR